MNFPLSPEGISAILGHAAPLANVRANWPLIEAALDKRGIYSVYTAIAAIGTVAVETGSFAPVKESGGAAYLASLYEGRKDLGNVEPGDGAKFCGRGFIQITGRWDYTHFGAEIGRDLVSNPELALDPAVAAGILALYFDEHGIVVSSEQQNWEIVRQRINGGLNGWLPFFRAVTELRDAVFGKTQSKKDGTP